MEVSAPTVYLTSVHADPPPSSCFTAGFSLPFVTPFPDTLPGALPEALWGHGLPTSQNIRNHLSSWPSPQLGVVFLMDQML